MAVRVGAGFSEVCLRKDAMLSIRVMTVRKALPRPRKAELWGPIVRD